MKGEQFYQLVFTHETKSIYFLFTNDVISMCGMNEVMIFKISIKNNSYP